MSKTFLIVGGTGLIGSSLKKRLLEEGNLVRILSHSPSKVNNIDSFFWDPSQSIIDQDALEGVDVLINITGASIGDKRWSVARKKILWESRIQSTRLLLQSFKEKNLKLKCYIGASAVGVFGNRGAEFLTENSTTSTDHFLGDLCKAWESAHQNFKQVTDRVVIIRIGVVLSNKGGALPKLRRSVILGIGAYFGDGKQYMSWIHLIDLVRIFIYVIHNEGMKGVVHGVAPNPVTNTTFIKTLTSMSKGPGWLLPIPSFLLNVVLGEMASVILFSQRVVSPHLEKHKFIFKYDKLKDALQELRLSNHS